MKHKVTEIQIVPIKPKDGLIGFASVVLDASLCLTSIGIHQKLDGTGIRLTYPTKRVGDRSMNIFHPITKELSAVVEEAVFAKFKDVMNKTNDRYNGFNHA